MDGAAGLSGHCDSAVEPPGCSRLSALLCAAAVSDCLDAAFFPLALCIAGRPIVGRKLYAAVAGPSPVDVTCLRFFAATPAQAAVLRPQLARQAGRLCALQIEGLRRLSVQQPSLLLRPDHEGAFICCAVQTTASELLFAAVLTAQPVTAASHSAIGSAASHSAADTAANATPMRAAQNTSLLITAKEVSPEQA